MSLHEDLTKKTAELAPPYLSTQGPLSAARFKVLCERIEQDEEANAKALADFSERIEGEVRVRKEQDARMLKRVEALEKKSAKPMIAIDFESPTGRARKSYADRLKDMPGVVDWSKFDWSKFEGACAAMYGLPTDVLMGRPREPYAPWPMEKYHAPKDAEQRAFNAGWDARKLAELKHATKIEVQVKAPAGRAEDLPDFIARDRFGQACFKGDLIIHTSAHKRLKLAGLCGASVFSVEPGAYYVKAQELWQKSDPASVRDEYHPNFLCRGGKFNEVLLKGDTIKDASGCYELVAVNEFLCTIKGAGKFSTLAYERTLSDFWLAAPAAAK